MANTCIDLAGRLAIPERSAAILWDMDGVLIDSLGLALNTCNRLLRESFSPEVQLDDAFIRSIFAYHTAEYWQRILQHVEQMFHVEHAQDEHARLLARYDQARREACFQVNPGIKAVLQAARARQLKMAVVSNNPLADVEKILQQAGILDYFDQIVGNDLATLEKKPAPDTYLYAAQLLELDPPSCVVVEDSLIGIEAGSQAGCHVIAVATGGTEFDTLASSCWTNRVYESFQIPKCRMRFGDVRQKSIDTPNEFVTHMLEHIAWRLGVEVDAVWWHDDWRALGVYVGQCIRQFDVQSDAAAALGMIDDGSAEVSIHTAEAAEFTLNGIDNLDLDWFLGLRCEQMTSGQPLVQLMQGLAEGLDVQLQVRVCSVEDPHHTWEGIFRSIGIALHRMFAPPRPPALSFDNDLIEESDASGELCVLARSLHYARVFRGTAESHVSVSVDFSRSRPNQFHFEVAPSIDMSAFPVLLERLAEQAGFTLQVEFQATVLSSSHVVMEDTALVMGRALLEILTLRMVQWGVHGAGSSVHTELDLQQQAIRVGLSVEGRKFWLFVPFGESYTALKQQFLLGQDVCGSLRSEDMDDFLDGLSGGLACSIIVHVQELVSPDQGWPLVFDGLGRAICEAFALNPYRKGVPPGVKATLA